MNVRKPLVLSAVLIGVGVALLVADDRGERLVTFSRSHGLTPLDAAGALLLLAGWALAVVALRRVPTVRERVRVLWRGGWAPLLTGLGAGLVIAGAARDFEGWWAVGAGVLHCVQLAGAASGLRGRDRPR